MRTALFILLASAPLVAIACGESRRPIGAECIRNDDCLSGYCGARSCVSAPTLVTGVIDSPGDEEPRIPTSEAAAPIVDAAGGS